MTQTEQWVLPTLALKLVHDIFNTQTETSISFTSKRYYSKTREAYPAAIFVLRKILIDGDLWYLRKNDVENSVDDIFARRFEFKEEVIFADQPLSIQVTRIIKDKSSIVERIKKKAEGSDLRGVSLVCHMIRDEIIVWDELTKQVQKLKLKAKDITVIGNVGESKFIVAQVFPVKIISFVNVDLIRINAPEMIEAEQVMNSKESGITHLGRRGLLTTDFRIVPIFDKST